MLWATFASLQVLLHLDFVRCVILTQLHQRGIYGDTSEPSGKSGPMVEISYVEESVNEAVLNGVLSVLAISRYAIRDAKHLFAMPSVKLIEGGPVASLGGLHQLFVSHDLRTKVRRQITACRIP